MDAIAHFCLHLKIPINYSTIPPPVIYDLAGAGGLRRGPVDSIVIENACNTKSQTDDYEERPLAGRLAGNLGGTGAGAGPSLFQVKLRPDHHLCQPDNQLTVSRLRPDSGGFYHYGGNPVLVVGGRPAKGRESQGPHLQYYFRYIRLRPVVWFPAVLSAGRLFKLGRL